MYEFIFKKKLVFRLIKLKVLFKKQFPMYAFKNSLSVLLKLNFEFNQTENGCLC